MDSKVSQVWINALTLFRVRLYLNHYLSIKYTNMNTTVNFVWKMLGYAYGAVLILAGLDKVTGIHFLADWAKYISPLAENVVPLDPTAFLIVLGIAEIAVGVLFFTRFVQAAAIITIVVLVLIIIDLINLGIYDIAARDALIAVGAFAVIKLTTAQGYTLKGQTRSL